jgi:hypothetical protein
MVSSARYLAVSPGHSIGRSSPHYRRKRLADPGPREFVEERFGDIHGKTTTV